MLRVRQQEDLQRRLEARCERQALQLAQATEGALSAPARARARGSSCERGNAGGGAEECGTTTKTPGPALKGLSRNSLEKQEEVRMV